MRLNAKNENIRIGDMDCDYISFGTGKEVLIMLPGVGDGLKTAKGMAIPFSVMYKCYAEQYKVYLFSRRNNLPAGFTTKDMAEDLNSILKKIGIVSANVLGVSQGGMIAQELAIHHPDKVKRLVLAVTASRPNDIMRDTLDTWLSMLDRDDYRGFMIDSAERAYTGEYLKRGIKLNSLIAGMKPKDYTRFRILCNSCIEHNSYDDLIKITCPTLLIAADQDKVLGAEASVEMKERIPDSKLYMYKGYSHGVYEQAKDFNGRVMRFLAQ